MCARKGQTCWRNPNIPRAYFREFKLNVSIVRRGHGWENKMGKGRGVVGTAAYWRRGANRSVCELSSEECLLVSRCDRYEFIECQAKKEMIRNASGAGAVSPWVFWCKAWLPLAFIRIVRIDFKVHSLTACNTSARSSKINVAFKRLQGLRKVHWMIFAEYLLDWWNILISWLFSYFAQSTSWKWKSRLVIKLSLWHVLDLTCSRRLWIRQMANSFITLTIQTHHVSY